MEMHLDTRRYNMYRGYEPNAIMIEASGRIVRLFTYDACSSLKEAKQVIKKME